MPGPIHHWVQLDKNCAPPALRPNWTIDNCMHCVESQNPVIYKDIVCSGTVVYARSHLVCQ